MPIVLAITATTALGQSPETAPDGTWVTLSGTVTSVTEDSFRLDTGDGIATVEMDDFDSYSEAYSLFSNDLVIVQGRVDDDLYEKRTIEASSAYVVGLGRTFFASAVDEEDYGTWWVSPNVVPGQVTMTGLVTKVDGRTITIATGGTAVNVDTTTLPYNPVDNLGAQRVRVGDRVRVSGDLKAVSLFDNRAIAADWLVTLD